MDTTIKPKKSKCLALCGVDKECVCMCGYRSPIFQFLLLFVGFSFAAMLAMSIWYAFANYHKVPCNISNCQLVTPETGENCDCTHHGDIESCDFCYSIQCLANVSVLDTSFRKMYLPGPWRNITLAQKMEELQRETECTVTPYDRARASPPQTYTGIQAQFASFTATSIILVLFLLVILMENFYHGIKHPVSELGMQLKSFTKQGECYDHPLHFTALDYRSSNMIFVSGIFSLILLVGAVIGTVYWVISIHSIFSTTAYITNCVQTPPDYLPWLISGVSCHGVAKVDGSLLNWTFKTGGYWTYELAQQELLELNNSNVDVHYWSDYDEVGGKHYMTLYDNTDLDVFQNNQKKVAGGILCTFCTSMLVGFGVIRECWRRKLRRDYVKFRAQRPADEAQPLLSPVANSSRVA